MIGDSDGRAKRKVAKSEQTRDRLSVLQQEIDALKGPVGATPAGSGSISQDCSRDDSGDRHAPSAGREWRVNLAGQQPVENLLREFAARGWQREPTFRPIDTVVSKSFPDGWTGLMELSGIERFAPDDSPAGVQDVFVIGTIRGVDCGE